MYFKSTIVFFICSSIAMANPEIQSTDALDELTIDLSSALEISENEEVREQARDLLTTSMSNNSNETARCSTGSETPTNQVRSPLDRARLNPDQINTFFNFQFMLTGENGEQSFTSIGIPRINMRDTITNFVRINRQTREEVLARDAEQLRIILSRNTTLTGAAREDAVNNSLLLFELSSANSESAMYTLLAERMQNESFGRKVSLLANLLSYLNDNYDDSATRGSENAGTTVTDIQLLNAIHQSISSGEVVPAGVCRHMHQLAVKFARAMGINEAFGVGYNSANGGHRTLVLTHPDDPTQVVQMNYWRVSTHQGVSGPAALSQNHTIPDTGIRFRIYNGNDQPAIILPSEQGAILNAVTGGEDRDLSPDFRSNAVIQQFGINTPYGTVRVFNANNSTGNQAETTGAAYNARVNYNSVFYGEYGIAGFHSTRPTQEGGVTSSGAYLRITQGFNWQFFTSDDINLSTFGELHLRGTAYCSTEGENECSANGDYNVDTQAGIAADYSTGPLNHRTSLLLQIQHDQSHASNNNIPAPMLPVVRLNHGINLNIDGVDLNFGAGITGYNLGTGFYATYDGNFAIHSPQTGTTASVGASGRLINETPYWLPNAEHQGRLNINQEIIGELLKFGVDLHQSFDVLENQYLGVNLNGQI